MTNGIKRILSLALAAALAALTAGCTNTPEADGPAKHVDEENAVRKKGVCVSRYNTENESASANIEALDADWFYTWGTSANATVRNAQFVPMVWGKAQAEDEDALKAIEQGYKSGRYTHLLTFNEPDLLDQSNMTVEQALEYWDALEELGIPLSSPAVSYYGATDGNAWLDSFMEKAISRGKRVDFIAIHIYQSFYSSGAVTELKNTLTALYDKYGLPIWLTEFGAIDIIARDAHADKVNPGCTAKNASTYITQATNMLECSGFVERYAWFVDNFNERGDARPWEAPFTTLYGDDDAMSETGKTYKDVATNYPLKLETKKLDAAKVGVSYSARISAVGGTGDYTFAASGLPKGLSITRAGTLSGKPETRGTYPVTVTVTDSGKTGRRQTLSHKFTITIK